MEDKDFEKKLQRGYQEMINHITDFIEKEGKTVKEAVDAAEDKLSEWGELTREEVLKISNEVRHDIGHFGETWEEAKTYFHKKLSFDAEYLKESVWDRLSSLANNATLDFIEFQKDLQQRVGDVVDDLYAGDSQDQSDYHNDHETWLTEIYLWQQEYKDAEDKLATMTQALHSHAEQLQQHAQEVRLHIKETKKHENTSITSDEKENQGEEKNKSHQQQADLHLKLKEEQQQAIILIDKLHKLLNK